MHNYKTGKIIKLISNDYSVLFENQVYVCKSRGNFRYQGFKPLVGDNVEFNPDNKIIMNILKRKNELVRPPVANIDQALIVTNVYPSFSSNLLDKWINIIEFNNIEPIICFTKLDLVDDAIKKEIGEVISYYKKIGYRVFINTEVEELKNKGYKEVTLLGQNVNAYGKDLDDVSFARLLELVSDTGIPRIRFVTSHPWDFTDEMIDVIAKRDNIMPYIHLPLQSGSSRI